MSIEKFEPSYDIFSARLEKLKSAVPEAFADGKINWDVLKECLGEFVEEEGQDQEHYTFTWPGKRDARRLAAKPPQGTLVPAPGEGVNENKTDNIFIEGDNLEVLKLLQKSYASRIKMIYIDPPYNTGKDFVYCDNFSQPLDEYLKLTNQIDAENSPLVSNKKSAGRFHSKWLSMMYPRLHLARSLLINGGVIFVSIDSTEINNLRLLMDEVFGEENFIELLTVVRSKNGMGSKEGFSTNSDFILCYRKPRSFEEDPISFYGLPASSKYVESFDKEDEHGKYKIDGIFRKKGDGQKREDSPGCFYPVYYDEMGKVYLEDGNGRKSVTPKLPNGEDGRWIWSRPYAEPRLHRLYASKGGTIYVKDYWSSSLREKPKSVLDDNSYITEVATEEIKALFSEKIFDTVKPVELIKLLISHASEEGDIILDFFAGSATTAHAVMELNNRRFILVQIPEPCEANSEALKAGYVTIAEIGKERVRRAIRNLKKASENKVQDFGFKVFKLQKSHFKEWRDYTGLNLEELKDLFSKQEDALIAGWKLENLTLEVMLQEGFPLHSRIETIGTIKNNEVVQIKSEFCEHHIFVCLDEKIDKTTIEQMPLTDKDIFICLDSALVDEQKVALSDKGIIKTI